MRYLNRSEEKKPNHHREMRSILKNKQMAFLASLFPFATLFLVTGVYN
jgi:hypothetical protein